jgi:DICT domain-containing protein
MSIGSMGFDELIASVEGGSRTLSLYNVDLPARVIDTVESHFAPQHVTLRRVRTGSETPTNFAVLHDGAGFIAASDLRVLHEYVDVRDGVLVGDDLGVPYPEILAHVDDTTFIDYGKARMILASREIETRAYRGGVGTLHAGFQRLSQVDSRSHVYRKLGDSDLDVHVYGLDDGSVPEELNVTAHGSDSEEIAHSWFVVYDGGESGRCGTDRAGDGVITDGDASGKCALLAQEVVEDSYRGFWTFDSAVVDRILARIEANHCHGE